MTTSGIHPMSVWELLDDWFESAPLKAAVAAGGIQDFQQGPRSGGTGFVLLHYLVGAPAGLVRGRVPWRAGPAAFTEAAEQAARRAGVTVRTGAPVARVQVKDDAVAGVVLEGGEVIDSRYVLSTADPARTFLDWVDPVWLDPEFIHAVRNIRFRGCTAVVLYALGALPRVPGLAAEALAGIVTLTPHVESLERAADAIPGLREEALHLVGEDRRRGVEHSRERLRALSVRRGRRTKFGHEAPFPLRRSARSRRAASHPGPPRTPGPGWVPAPPR